MKFTSSRKLVLEGFGHVLVFGKGDTLFVPPALHQRAVEQGLEPVLLEGEEAPKAPKTPDDAARITAIKDAMRAIAERNSADDFTAGGLPKVRAIEALTGGVRPADTKEHQALWAEVVASVGA